MRSSKMIHDRHSIDEYFATVCNMMIPFEFQSRPDSCGAAALAIVYRSFGIKTNQEIVFHETGRSRRMVRLASHTRKTGFQSIIVQWKDGWKGICAARRACPDAQVILNHRLFADSGHGHYSVVSDLLPENDIIIVHDPMFGPGRYWDRGVLERLWEIAGGEIRGRAALLVAKPVDREAVTRHCPHCRTPVAENLVELVSSFCERLFCTGCDRTIAEKA